MSTRADVDHVLEEHFPTPEQRGAFLTWALGPAYQDRPLTETPTLWNARHGAALTVRDGDDVRRSLTAMVHAYKEKTL